MATAAVKSKPKKASCEHLQLALAKLATSGLDEEDMKALRIEALSPEQMQVEHSTFKALPALKLNYIDPFTKRPQEFQSKWGPFSRYRYLKMSTDIQSLAGGKPQRYVQAPDSGVCAYFPSNIDWTDVLSNPTKSLNITEGELKAAKACKEGFPTIGLGGVYNWKSKKYGISFLEDLARVNWVKRIVRIIFDSDFQINPNVCKAANELAEELYQHGAIVCFVTLPDVVQGGKTGLDDFLVHAEGIDPLGTLFSEASQSLTLSRPMWEMNKEVVYIHDPGIVIVQGTGQKINPAHFKTHAYADRQHAELHLKADGSVSLKKAPLADRWIEWPMRYQLGKLSYAPGKSQEILGDTMQSSSWNAWPGWGCAPKKGDASLFFQLLKHLFAGADPEDLRWFIQWLAYPLQHPGAKLLTFAAIHGNEQGTGKSLIAYTMREIYGKNFSEITQEALNGSFTGWAANKNFVLVDDVTGHDSKELYDKLKSMATRKEIPINLKYVPEYSIRDCLNFVFTSNRPDAFYLEDKDRRFFVHRVTVGPLESEFYARYDAAIEAKLDENEKRRSFASAVFHALLQVDLSDFNPNAPARMTQAKALMTESVKTDLELWVAALRDDAESVLRHGNVRIEGDMFTNAELLSIYEITHANSKVTQRSLGVALVSSGIPTFRNKQPIMTTKGNGRYYVVRNHEKWLNAATHAAIAHINGLYKQGGIK